MHKKQPRRPPTFTGPNGERRSTSPVRAAVQTLNEIISKYEADPIDAPDPDGGSQDLLLTRETQGVDRSDSRSDRLTA